MNAELGWKLFSAFCYVLRWITGRLPKRPRILIVEDNPSDAELLQIRLRKRGYDSEIASSGETAAGMVKHSHYSAAFVDMRLPGMPGEALVRLLSRECPHTNIIVVCGQCTDLCKIPDGIFVSYMSKPPTLEAIEDMLAKLKI